MNMKKNGFTLVELMIAIAVGMIILTAIYASVNMAQRSSVSVGRKVVTQQDVRTVLDIMAMEIRMASFNPRSSTFIWSTIPTAACASMGNVAPVAANKGIQVATANTILFAMDIGGTIDPVTGRNLGSGTIGDYPNEYIEYSYNGVDTITRNVSCGGDQPILGGVGSATMVRNANTNPVTPLFQYFDKDGAVTATIPLIRRIRIMIVAETENKDSLTNNVRTMTYTTDILVKNHVYSP